MRARSLSRRSCCAPIPQYWVSSRSCSVRGGVGHGHCRLFHRADAVGGPKLVPAISPKKTWSGAIGGTIAAVRRRRRCRAPVRASATLVPLAAIACAAVDGLRRPAICSNPRQAPVRRQGRGQHHSGTWRTDGPARRLRVGRCSPPLIGLVHGGYRHRRRAAFWYGEYNEHPPASLDAPTASPAGDAQCHAFSARPARSAPARSICSSAATAAIASRR